MLTTPIDVLYQFPVRKTKKQKQAFRDAVQSYAESLGYQCRVEKGSMGVNNMVIGDPKIAKYLVTAHYDTGMWSPIPDILMPNNPVLAVLYQLLLITGLVLVVGLSGSSVIILLSLICGSGVFEAILYSLLFCPVLGFFIVFFLLPLPMLLTDSKANTNCNSSGVITLLEIARTMPENQRNKVCFVLFDHNELGLLGSRAYKKAHKESVSRQVMLNLYCVGDGDHLLMIPNPCLKKTPEYKKLFQCCGYFGSKNLLVKNKGINLIPLDHIGYSMGLSIMAFRKNKVGHYISRIHTPKDTVLDITNVNILRAAITTLISSDAAQ